MHGEGEVKEGGVDVPAVTWKGRMKGRGGHVRERSMVGGLKGDKIIGEGEAVL